ncbi:hypothetical protein SANTM175S_05522 [Streptomyces antimycoticus]
MTISAAGNTGAQICWMRKPRSVASMPPQVAAGGCTPTPRKVSEETTSRQVASAWAAVTMTVGRTLLQMWVRSTRPTEAPNSSADSTYWACRRLSAAARVIRKNSGA